MDLLQKSNQYDWIYRGGVRYNPIQTPTTPSVAVHNGLNWLAFVGNDHTVRWLNGTNKDWSDPIIMRTPGFTITSTRPPVLVEYKGLLYALVNTSMNYWGFYQFDDTDQSQTWILKSKEAFVSSGPTAAIEFNNELIAVTVDAGNVLKFTMWLGPLGDDWAQLAYVASNESTQGVPALCSALVDGLSLVFISNDPSRALRLCSFNPDTCSWSPSALVKDLPYTPDYGVCTVSAFGNAYICFQSNDAKGLVFAGSKAPSKGLGGATVVPNQSSAFTPTMAINNGVTNLVYAANNDTHTILWTQKPLFFGDDGVMWMSAIMDDNELLSNLTIPGTHDSAAYKPTYIPFVQTQTMDFELQLNAGIRYFDLRCAMNGSTVMTAHGNIMLDDTLESIFTTMYNWLDINPREALIAQIKYESGADKNPDPKTPFTKALAQLFRSYPNKWRMDSTTPTLGEARGKIQLIRRYGGDGVADYGIDVSRGWVDNPAVPFKLLTPSNVEFNIQDYYTPAGNSINDYFKNKWNAVNSLFANVQADTDHSNWYLNFTSASIFQGPAALTPYNFAMGTSWPTNCEGINSMARDLAFYAQGPIVRLGVVPADYPEGPDIDFILVLILSNFNF